MMKQIQFRIKLYPAIFVLSITMTILGVMDGFIVVMFIGSRLVNVTNKGKNITVRD